MSKPAGLLPLLSLGLCVSLGLACGASQTEADAPASQPSEPAVAAEPEAAPEDERTLNETMHAYVWRIIDGRDLLVAGELDAARSSLATLAATAPPSNTPERWTGAIGAVRGVAGRGAAAEDLAGVASAIGEATMLCGTCHAGVGAGPGLSFADPPDLDDTLEAQMHRHVWASDRLWEGLVAPSDERWTAGVAAVFADSALTGPTATGPSEIEWALTMTQEQLAASNASERADFYGDFIAACASCHRQTGLGPASP